MHANRFVGVLTAYLAAGQVFVSIGQGASATSVDPPAFGVQRIDLTVRGIAPGIPFELLSSSSLAGTNWFAEAVGFGAANQDKTTVCVNPGERTNALFFRARTWTATGNQAFVTLADTNPPLTAIVNGKLVTLQPLAHNLVAINLPVTSLNFGYGMDDGGPTNIPTLSPQQVTSFAGLTAALSSLTNFCASQNPIARLDLHSLPTLTDIECFQCRNLAWVNVTNCPSLKRACFEQCAIEGTLNFTGDTNLTDIRGAENQYTNIIFGGAGRKIWHFCVRDNPQLQQVKLTNFYALQEWLMWNSSQTGAITRTTLPSTNLTTVEIWGNQFDYADFSKERKLTLISASENYFTNVLITGSTALTDVNFENNLLGTKALDHILTNISAITGHGGVLRLRSNPGYPSATGYAAAVALSTRTDPTKRWIVYVDYPPIPTNAVIGGDGTPGGTNSITFVTLGRAGSTSLSMHLAVSGSATVTWHWANGTTTTGAGDVVTSFKDKALVYHTNYVTVSPASAVTEFGKPNNFPDQEVWAISGISRWPNLARLYLSGDSLKTLSLAGCSPAISQIFLDGNPVSADTVDRWLIDLDAATGSTQVVGGQFSFPGLRTSASDAAVDRLTQKGWSLNPQ